MAHHCVKAERSPAAARASAAAALAPRAFHKRRAPVHNGRGRAAQPPPHRAADRSAKRLGRLRQGASKHNTVQKRRLLRRAQQSTPCVRRRSRSAAEKNAGRTAPQRETRPSFSPITKTAARRVRGRIRSSASAITWSIVWGSEPISTVDTPSRSRSVRRQAAEKCLRARRRTHRAGRSPRPKPARLNQKKTPRIPLLHPFGIVPQTARASTCSK